MSFVVLRYFLTSALFNAGLGYAAFIAIYGPCSEKPIEQQFKDETETKEYSEEENKKSRGIELPLSSLKLWIMLTFFFSLSYLGADSIPLFLELRVIFTWFILFVPSASRAILYDKAFSPLFDYIGQIVAVTRNKEVFIRGIGFVTVRCCVELAVFITNYARRRGMLEEDAAHDIIGGLLFTRRALQDLKKMEACRRKGLPSPYNPVNSTC